MPSHADTAFSCSLLPAELRQRRRLAKDTLLQHVVTSVSTPDCLTVTFRGGTDVHRAVETFAEYERVCCDFLNISVEKGSDGVTLTISSPPEGLPVLRQFRDALDAANVA